MRSPAARRAAQRRFRRDKVALLRWQDANRAMPFCAGCPDHEACSQGACYLLGGPAHPLDRCPSNGCRMCSPTPSPLGVDT